MPQIRVLCAVVLFAACAAACGRSGMPIGEPIDAESPTPAEPSAEPTPEPVFDPGDGHDGPGAFATDTELDLCVPLVVAEGESATIAVGPHPFKNGDRVFLHQVQDSIATGPGTPLLGAGAWTVARIRSINGATISLDRTVDRFESSPPAKIAQACRAPEYSSLDVSATLRPRAWNGASGGVIVLYVQGAATIEGEIDASGRGFAGGRVGPSSPARPTADDVPLGDGGGKGEGLIGGTWQLAGRGAKSTDGGGGNGNAAGGGGGGSAGAGGVGGGEASEVPSPNADAGGRGGRSLSAPPVERVFFGGGGGAGQRSVGSAGAGGRGGGIVIVFAGAFTGRVAADADGRWGGDSGEGGNGPNPSSRAGGAGGGGAGGSILLWSETASSPYSVYVSADGGRGGDSIGDGPLRSGPGGGGGGGFVQLSRLGSNVYFDIEGGNAGESVAESGRNPYGATAGANGWMKIDP